MAGKHGLGRGLSSLIPQKNLDVTSSPEGTREKQGQHNDMPQRENRRSFLSSNAQKQDPSDEANKTVVLDVAIGTISENTLQPRLYFNEEKLTELADSIREHGILQPLTVITRGDGYELIAGERRLRASKKAGLTTVPVIVRDDVRDQEKLELAIIENVQRHDLNVIEEGKSYKKLADDFDLSQEEIAKKTGKSRSAVANRMRLTKLPIEVQRGLIDGKISEGHAKVILSLDSPEKQRALYTMIVEEKYSVRDAERKVHNLDNGTLRVGEYQRQKKSAYEKELEDQLSKHFATKVRVLKKGHGGEIRLQYFSEEEIKNILEKLAL